MFSVSEDPAMSNRQAEIAAALDVVPPFADEAALVAEVERRKRFIKNCLQNSGLKVRSSAGSS